MQRKGLLFVVIGIFILFTDVQNVHEKQKDARLPRKEGAHEIYKEKKACPLCGAIVMHLPRHLRSKAHKWSASKAKSASQIFSLRKNYTWKDNKIEKAAQNQAPDYHKYRKCAYPGCESIVKRPSQHLQVVHKLPPKSKLLEHYLNRARRLEREALLEVSVDSVRE